MLFQLLEGEQFIAVDKIKTAGNVYMFAVGLKPQYTIDVSFYCASACLSMHAQCDIVTANPSVCPSVRHTLGIVSKRMYISSNSFHRLPGHDF